MSEEPQKLSEKVTIITRNAYHVTSGAGVPVALQSNLAVPCSGTNASDIFLTIAGFLTATEQNSKHVLNNTEDYKI